MRDLALNLSAVTAVDLGYIDLKGKLVGHSFKPIITVHGPVTDDEQVIEDFGSIKKRIKAAIDDKLTGYDHKLVYDPSVCAVLPSYKTGVSSLSVEDGRLLVTGDSLAFRPLKFSSLRSTAITVDRVLCQELEGYLNSTFQPLSFEVSSDVRGEGLMPFMDSSFGTPLTKPLYFSYTHGLPKSSSWGCQFIAHGHFSFIQLLSDRDYYPMVHHNSDEYLDLEEHVEVALDIATSMEGSYLVNREYQAKTRTEIGEYIRYNSRDRGAFELQMSTDYMPIIGLDTETTVENIARYIAARWKDKLTKTGISALYVSEGLQKGALVRFD